MLAVITLEYWFSKIYFIDYTITVVPFFLPLVPLYPVPSLLPSFSSYHHSPPEFMSRGHTYKFFGFSTSYSILNLPLSILYLPFMLLIPCTFSLILPCFPADNPPCDLYFCESVPVLVFVYFCFCYFRFDYG